MKTTKRKKNRVVPVLFGSILLGQSLFSVTINADSPEDPLTDLIGTVMMEDVPEMEIDSDLEFIIGEFYADTLIPMSMANNVLSYLTEIYKDHGYKETGSWVPSSFQAKRSVYNPKESELPPFRYENFFMPVPGRLNSSYGWRESFGRMHKGIDISLKVGDTVRVALPGVVKKIAYDGPGYGNYVVVAHSGNVETLYAHLSAALVAPGQYLAVGAPVGLGGVTGNSTGPHLHFETRYKGVAKDPVPWFNLQGRFKK